MQPLLLSVAPLLRICCTSVAPLLHLCYTSVTPLLRLCCTSVAALLLSDAPMLQLWGTPAVHPLHKQGALLSNMTNTPALSDNGL